MPPIRSRSVAALAVAALALGALSGTARAAGPTAAAADARLDQAIRQLVGRHGWPPGVAVVVQRGASPALHSAGVAVVPGGPAPQLDDSMRVASVAKAFSGAVALAVVRDGTLRLDTTIGQQLPSLPSAWARVTLAQLLNHTSGLPDFSQTKAFATALNDSPLAAPPMIQLVSSVVNEPLGYPPGSKYHYSNTDNVVVALMVEAATHRPYAEVLEQRVVVPFGLSHTSLPSDAALPSPAIHGYAPEPGAPGYTDVTSLFAAGWSAASGGVVSSPADANRFVRRYVTGATTNATGRARQFRFVAGGSSEPPGPGTNAAGLALFRYQTSCGTVYGHTGNTPGYTQFVAASRDGTRSTTVSVNTQITPKNDAKQFATLRHLEELAVCAALARG